MKIGIIGSRGFNDYSMIEKTLNYITTKNDIKIDIIVSGGANGADKLGESYASNNNIQTLIFKADWDKYGKSAGYKRNVDIVNNSDIIIAFWDEISKGTNHSINIAKDAKKPIIIIKYLINKFESFNTNLM